MATGTLTGQTVANTYKSLLKVTGTTAGGETLGADTVIAIEDGDGNASSLSLSQQRATITLGSGAADDFIVDGTTLVVEGDNNRVGIGTASPAVTLDVEKSVAGNYIATFTNTHATDGYGILIKAGDDANVRPLTVRDKDNTDLLTVKGDGDVTVSTGNLVIGTAGKGISFAATSDGGVTTPSELLDDYEEGTWTPVYAFTTPGDSSITADDANGGTYTKVGNVVHIKFFISADAVTNSSGSGNLTITGLPFTASGEASNGTMSIGYTSNFNVAANYPQGIRVADSGTLMNLYRYNSSYGIQTNVISTDLKNASNSSIIYASGSYKV